MIIINQDVIFMLMIPKHLLMDIALHVVDQSSSLT